LPDSSLISRQASRLSRTLHVQKWSTYAFWKRQARTWHWMSGAICLLGMMLFALTGITLNHAHQIPAQVEVTEQEMILPGAALSSISTDIKFAEDSALPNDIVRAVRQEIGVNLAGKTSEWTDIDVYVSLPRPGGDGWISIDRETGGPSGRSSSMSSRSPASSSA
jgi:hypothetical protein